MRRVVITRRTLLFVISSRLLAVPHGDKNLESAPFFFSAPGRPRSATTGAEGKKKGSQAMSIDNLMSGCISSIATVLLTLLFAYLKKRKGRRNLYRAIASECVYNLSILDEVTNGIVNYDGSFKRMSVEFFKTIRQQTVEYGLKPKLLQDLSRLIVNLELFNLEADYKFNGKSDAQTFSGRIGLYEVSVERKNETVDIRGTVESASAGVRGSLNDVRKSVAEELGDDSLIAGTYEEGKWHKTGCLDVERCFFLPLCVVITIGVGIGYGLVVCNAELMLSRPAYVLSLVVIVVAFISLVVLEGLRYWFEIRMEREHRLAEKNNHDLTSD